MKTVYPTTKFAGGIKIENAPKIENSLVQLARMAQSTRQIWVNVLKELQLRSCDMSLVMRTPVYDV